MSYSKSSELLFKILIIGEGGTGKTCLIRRYVHSIFLATNKATIGVDFALKDVVHPATGRNITLQLWDIAGQERYGQMTRVYYQAAAGAIVVADITRPETLELAVKWKQDVDSKVFMGATGRPIPCVLLINKVDLLPVKDDGSLSFLSSGNNDNNNNVVGCINKTREEMDEFCRQHGFEAWFVTSAKENRNVDAAFQKLVDCVLAATEELGGEADAGVGNDRSSNGKLLYGNRTRNEKKSGCSC